MRLQRVRDDWATFTSLRPSLWANCQICTRLLEKPQFWRDGPFVGNVMSLLPNMLSRFVIAFLPRSKQSFNLKAAVILEPKENGPWKEKPDLGPGGCAFLFKCKETLKYANLRGWREAFRAEGSPWGPHGSQHPLPCPLQTAGCSHLTPTPARRSVSFRVRSPWPCPQHPRVHSPMRLQPRLQQLQRSTFSKLSSNIEFAA